MIEVVLRVVWEDRAAKKWSRCCKLMRIYVLRAGGAPSIFPVSSATRALIRATRDSIATGMVSLVRTAPLYITYSPRRWFHQSNWTVINASTLTLYTYQSRLVYFAAVYFALYRGLFVIQSTQYGIFCTFFCLEIPTPDCKRSFTFLREREHSVLSFATNERGRVHNVSLLLAFLKREEGSRWFPMANSK